MKTILIHLIAALIPVGVAAQTPDPVVSRTTTQVILPAFAEFAAATAALSDAAAADCTAQRAELRDRYDAAFDAWLAAAPYRFGPLEKDGRNLAIAFWPDAKGAIPKTLAGMLAKGVAGVPYAQRSVAARGFFALEAMIYDPAFNGYGPGDTGCALVQAATADLAETAAGVAGDWQTFAPLLTSAGQPGNSRFQSGTEARQVLFTAFLTELEFTAEVRLGRPLGTIDRARPNRAEALEAGRPLRNVRLSLAAARKLAESLTDGASPTMMADFDYAQTVAGKMTDPTLASVETPGGRLKIQDLKDAIDRVRSDAIAELGPELSVTTGFNALDGD